MKIRYFLFLAASLMFALVFTFSCSSPSGNGPGGGGKYSSLYKGCKVNGVCTPLPSSTPDTQCQNLGGKIDRTCLFMNCKNNVGICSPVLSADECEGIGEIVSDQVCTGGGSGGSSSSRGGVNNPSSSSVGGVSNGQYCYFPIDEEDPATCILIGTNPRCYFSSTAECTRKGGTLQTLAYCNANANSSDIFGCDMGYCSLYGSCYEKWPQSVCTSEGGTFYENPCPASSSSRGGVNNPSSSSVGGVSNGQYCYDSEYSVCALMGTSASCYISNAAECREEGGVTQTLAYCNANAQLTLGCEKGGEGYCLYDGMCQKGLAQSICNVLEGNFGLTSCPSSPDIPSNGQYCYDGYMYCDLIGPGSGCYQKSAAECTRSGDEVKTYSWCLANAEVIAGCIYDYEESTANSLNKLSKPLNKMSRLRK